MKRPLSTLLILAVSVITFELYSNNSFSSGKEKPKTSTKSENKITQETKETNKPESEFSKSDFLNNIIKKVKADYVEEKSDEQLLKSAASGILSSLDPHSSYLDNEAYQEIKVQTKGEFGGIGIEMTIENSIIKVVTALEETPAYKAGIKSGDYITKIDGKSAIDISIEEAVKKLRGKPGSKVNITIIRKGQENPLEFSLRREIIKIKSVKSATYEDVAYIKINSFSEQSFKDVEKGIQQSISKVGGQNKLKGIVLDLRNNPGGLLDQSTKISDFFLDKGQKIVSIKGKNEQNNQSYIDSEEQTITKGIPLIVIINEGSASASEIVAGALQDNKRALVLGKQSFGKGSVQSVIPLDKNQGAIKLTTALYYTPSGKSIQARGITPDIVVSEAKIEKSDKIKDLRSEASLNGHLKNGSGDQEINQEEIKDNNGKIENIDLYNQDYQLARAIDLVRGISLYQAKQK